ncbi:MAG: hypothetical protein LC745_02850 [Planctomycetia bacterium]|nr:hypothetical protein [Planctomycetia bacterium]
MVEGQNPGTIDLIRWTFTVKSDQVEAIEAHLNDLGLDVLVRDDALFLVSWDEPEGNIDEVIEAIWALNGEPFEVTQEEFHRQNLLHLHHEDDGGAPGSERAVA